VEDHSSQIERYHLSTVYDESTYDIEDDLSFNESVPTTTIPFYGGMAIVSQNIFFIQSPMSDQNILCSYTFDLEKISGICDIEVLNIDFID
jgi:hypothetical protein